MPTPAARAGSQSREAETAPCRGPQGCKRGLQAACTACMVERLVHLLGIRAAARLRQLPSEPPASERRDAAQPSMQAAHADMAEESSRLAAQRALCRCGASFCLHATPTASLPRRAGRGFL